MESSTQVLRRMLDERGVEWEEEDGHTLWWGESTYHQASAYSSFLFGESERVHLCAMVTPAQAIAATLGNEGAGRSNDGVAELEAGTCRRVYLVEVSDDLIESWCPLSVYLHREAAEDCAEALRKEEDGVLQFARVSELKVVDDG